MRLNEYQKSTIRHAIQTVLGQHTTIRVFGSRIDDTAKGGDIDLLIEVQHNIQNPADIIARIAAKLAIALEDQKVDILLSAPNLKHLPIHEIAKKTGIEL